MTWTALRWVWRLEAPLFVGMPPAGALNRCRPYVPARMLWGAVTAEIARASTPEGFPNYKKLGDDVALNCRFTYLFPAEKEGEDFLVWTPKYVGKSQGDCGKNSEQQVGLRWHRMDGGGDESDRDFRRRLLNSRPGTAIAPESYSASEGTLRETECINPWWYSPNCQGKPSATLFLGYVFLHNNDFRRQLDDIDALFVGGDTRYGLGKISRVGWNAETSDLSVFGKRVHLDGEHPEIQSDIVWGHALEGDLSGSQDMLGRKELFGGWDKGSRWKGTLAWAPGSFQKKPVHWLIDENGCWQQRSSIEPPCLEQ